MRIPVMAILAVFLIETTPGTQATPLPERVAFMALVRSAIRLDSDLQKDFTYIERRRDVKVGAFGKVSVGPLRTFEVFPSADPTGTYKRLIAIDGKPLDPAELRRGDLEHQRDVENEAQKRRVETPAQQARRLEHVDLDRRQTQGILDDALRVFEAAIVTREAMDGEATIVVNMTPRANARVTTREGSWMKQFQGRAWFVEEDGQLARLDVRAINDVSIGWGIVGRLHKGSRILVERRRVGSLWLPWRLTFDATGRTLLFRTFDVDVVTEYSEYKRKESGSAATVDCRLPTVTVDCDCRLPTADCRLMYDRPMDPHAPLRDDVRMLGELLGDTLRLREGQALYEIVERVRALSKHARAGTAHDVGPLAGVLRDLPVESALPVARAFSHFLTLANIAEQHHRVRRRRDYQRNPAAGPQPASCEETFPRLIGGGVTPETLYDAACALRIELVLTAHPTEITRRTLIHKHLHIADALMRLDRPDLTVPERAETIEELRREIAAAWETEEIRPRKPDPLDEITSGLLIFEQTIWDALPRYLRSLDAALRRTTGRPLPLDAAPIRFGSWIGGDRDGNPHVTPEVTRVACYSARWRAADLYLRDVDALRLDLSMTDAIPELQARAGNAREPYRAVLRDVRRRLLATRERAGLRLIAHSKRVRGTEAATSPDRPEDHLVEGHPYESIDELIEPIALCYRSLVETEQQVIADGPLADLLRRTAAFGLTLVRLDVRQHAERHTTALDAVTRHLAVGSYAEWPEERRVAFLTEWLRDPSPSGLPELPAAGPEVWDVLDTFATIADIHPESLGAYIVSMARAPSDVLAVACLQRLAGSNLRIVPLFEQVEALHGAERTLRDLLALSEYRALIDGRQEVMVGYSDSAKDGGRLAANWALYTAQEELVAAARDADVQLTLFHGRGGSVSRGGGPTYLAIQSQPPGSIEGRLRVTEQGEMIQAQFGLQDIAVRTLELYTTATLDATLAPSASPPERWRQQMDALAADAESSYRRVVYDEPGFVPYFRAATPEVELGAMPIGSRPARRTAAGGVATLRAIPWVFAWTQTRLLLPTWLGTGEALRAAFDRGHRDILRELYREWPFFQSTIDLIAMVLAKADSRIAAEYDRQLVPPELLPIGEDLRRRLAETIAAILEVTGRKELLADNGVLRRSINVRNPYVDPINLVQIELLRRLRRHGAQAGQDIWSAFMITVNGIAAGMRNTG